MSDASPGARAAREVLAGIVRRSGLDVALEDATDEDGGRLVLELTGPDAHLLGTSVAVEALQYLVNRMASQALGGGEADGLPIFVDVDGYRRRRREELRALAAELADEARETGSAICAGDLTAYERRIVHVALHDEPGVESYSEGAGRGRRLWVEPA